MSGLGLAYLVGFLSFTFCGVVAFILITTVSHFDPPEAGRRA